MKFISNAVAASATVAAIFYVDAGNVMAAPNPVSAEPDTPTTQYSSPFKDYRPLGVDKRSPWKTANDEVAKIGGWRVYAREAATSSLPASESVAKPPTASSAISVPPNPPVKNIEKPMTMPMPDPHAGHGKPQ